MNQRRLFLLTLSAGLCIDAAQLRAQTPSAGMRRVGVLAPSTRAKEDITLRPFYERMREFGWVEGQNILYDRVYADDQLETLPLLAAKLVGRKPEVIYAPPPIAALAAKNATQTIPIVFAAVPDPVGIGLVTGLAHPGANVTGISSIGASLAPKRIDLLREILPNAKRLGRLADPNDPGTKLDQQAFLPLAARLGVTIIISEVANPVDMGAAIDTLVADGVDAIFMGGSTVAGHQIRRLVELANQRRVPIIAARPEFADEGALFAYGASLAQQLGRSAGVVDKILKGAKPADIPVEQPTLFELVVNLKAARALGITIPRSVLLRADRVIE
jgi:putative ABC transport system substrate-binding protein